MSYNNSRSFGNSGSGYNGGGFNSSSSFQSNNYNNNNNSNFNRSQTTWGSSNGNSWSSSNNNYSNTGGTSYGNQNRFGNNNNSSTNGGGYSNSYNSYSNNQYNNNNNNINSDPLGKHKGFYQAYQINQSVSTFGKTFTHKVEDIYDPNVSNCPKNGHFYHINTESQIANVSPQMVRMMDMIAGMNNGNQTTSYEYIAFEDFKQNHKNYKFFDLISGQGNFNVQQKTNWTSSSYGSSSYGNNSSSGYGNSYNNNNNNNTNRGSTWGNSGNSWGNSNSGSSWGNNNNNNNNSNGSTWGNNNNTQFGRSTWGNNNNNNSGWNNNNNNQSGSNNNQSSWGNNNNFNRSNTSFGNNGFGNNNSNYGGNTNNGNSNSWGGNNNNGNGFQGSSWGNNNNSNRSFSGFNNNNSGSQWGNNNNNGGGFNSGNNGSSWGNNNSGSANFGFNNNNNNNNQNRFGFGNNNNNNQGSSSFGFNNNSGGFNKSTSSFGSSSNFSFNPSNNNQGSFGFNQSKPMFGTTASGGGNMFGATTFGNNSSCFGNNSNNNSSGFRFGQTGNNGYGNNNYGNQQQSSLPVLTLTLGASQVQTGITIPTKPFMNQNNGNNNLIGLFGSQPLGFNNGNNNNQGMFSISNHNNGMNQPIIGNLQSIQDPYQAKYAFKSDKEIDDHILKAKLDAFGDLKSNPYHDLQIAIAASFTEKQQEDIMIDKYSPEIIEGNEKLDDNLKLMKMYHFYQKPFSLEKENQFVQLPGFNNQKSFLSNFKGQNKLNLTGMRIRTSQDDSNIKNHSPIIVPLSQDNLQTLERNQKMQEYHEYVVKTQEKIEKQKSHRQRKRTGSFDNNYEPLIAFKEANENSNIKLREADELMLPSNVDLMKVTFNFPQIGKLKESQVTFRIHKSRDVDDLYRKIEEILLQNYKMNQNKLDYIVLYKNVLLKRELSLEQANIIQNSQIYIQIVDGDEDMPKSSRKSSVNAIQNLPYAQKQLLPKPPKQGYRIQPDMADFARMTLMDLHRVENFIIQNEFGCIMFEGPTDLSEVDLGDLVTIKHKSAEVYDDRRHKKPEIGQKLNKKALITLFKFNVKKGKSQDEKNELLKQKIEAKGGEHMFYDMDKEIWQFRVYHF
ncbi:UNKNOWN [Stylonychia lemnae]|uniref:Peptidase S59 domain-containing protein n=1 Tax=Stylonychia lemnae TaxID=5949 RepID=A0A078A4C1_STYLE|nr:UNKNOWN [Stylonychia lemnae]|eukprot:CDW77103.1 UNKNOWN [Stylonychia lemnae]